MRDRPCAVVLLSGGLGSAVALSRALDEGFEVHAVTLRHGPADEPDAEAARHIARQVGNVRHRIVDVDCASAAEGRSGPGDRVAASVAYALAYAQAVGASDLFVGTCASSGEVAGEWGPEFVEALEHRAHLAAKAGARCSDDSCAGCSAAARGCSGPVRVHAPLTAMSRPGVRRLALSLGIDPMLARSDLGAPVERL